MLNLLKSDVYRLVHGKLLWVMLGVFTLCIAFIAWGVQFISAMTVEHGSSSSTAAVDVEYGEAGMGMSAEVRMETGEGGEEGAGEVLSVDAGEDDDPTIDGLILAPFKLDEPTAFMGSAFVSGGGITVSVALLVGLFLVSDLSTRFARNLVLDRRGRRHYYGEKLLLAAVLCALFLAVGIVETLTFFPLAGFEFSPPASADAIALWVVCTYLVIVAYAWLAAVIAWLVRSTAATATATLLLTSWFVGAFVLLAADLFASRAPWLTTVVHWLPYNNLSLVALGSAALQGPFEGWGACDAWVVVLVTSVVQLAVLAAFSLGVLRRRDM